MNIKNIKKYRNLTRLLYLLAIILTAGYFQSSLAVLLIGVAIIGGAFFCGWLCPFGALQELMGIIGKRTLKKRYNVPNKYHKYLQYFRYLFLLATPLGFGLIFIYDPQYSFLSFLSGFGFTMGVLVVFLFFTILSFFVDRPFCNYFCVNGARIGIMSAFRIFRIKRDEKTCIGCKICDKVCPMNIKVSDKKQVNNINCINCFECVQSCPKKSLKYGFLKLK